MSILRRCSKLISLSVLAVIAGAPASYGQVEAAPATASSKAPSLALSFELSSNKIYMQTKVNGQGPFPFVLDTGAPFTVVDWELAQSLGIKVFTTGEVGGAGHGTVKLGTATGVRLTVDGLRYQPRRMEIIPLKATLSPVEGRDVMGLLGGDVLERFVSEFDYEASVVRLHPAQFQYEGAAKPQPVTIEGHVLARATVTIAGREPISGRFIIDTGARLALSLNTHVVNEHKLLGDDIPHVTTIVGWGLGGPLEHGLTRAKTLSIGDVTFNAPTVALSQDTRGVLASRHITGIIGNEVLKRCRVFIDYGRDQLILEPVEAAMKTPFPADCSGLFITAGGEAGGEGYNVFTIYNVATGSPAAEAGMKAQDVINRVDGGPALRFTLEALRELLRVPDKTYELELKRGDEGVNVQLKTRQLI